MADWTKITSRGSVSDRRGMGGIIGGGGIAGVLLLMGITYLMGSNPLDVLLQTDPSTYTASVGDTTQYDGQDNYEVFVSTVLGSTNDFWKTQFEAQGKTYTDPQLVLFRGQTNSACGGAISLVGPHYCPEDSTIYLDETFFGELTKRLGAQGGDVAEAYVISHEVGHHAQNQLDLLAAGESNQASVQTELQADCFAGLWAGSLKDDGIFAEGEITEAVDAAEAVGDDSIQKKTQGEVQPETWTHGSSAQRVSAFNTGFSGNYANCTQ